MDLEVVGSIPITRPILFNDLADIEIFKFQNGETFVTKLRLG